MKKNIEKKERRGACLTIPKLPFIEKPAKFSKSKVSTAMYPNKTSETVRF